MKRCQWIVEIEEWRTPTRSFTAKASCLTCSHSCSISTASPISLADFIYKVLTQDFPEVLEDVSISSTADPSLSSEFT